MHGIKEKSKNGTGYEAAAAILVQTIFLKRRAFEGILGEQAAKSATLAAST